MIVVTGGYGFIGTNVVKALRKAGEEVLIVDKRNDLFIQLKYHNKEKCVDYIEFLTRLNDESYRDRISAIVHLGAESSTTNKAKDKIMKHNLMYSVTLANYCLEYNIPFIYASSASIYGDYDFLNKTHDFKPLNNYAKSKKAFDDLMESKIYSRETESMFIGLRFFNVYGPYEFHKYGQSSPIYRYWKEARENGEIVVYCGPDGKGNDAINYSRDFVHVDDICNIIYFLIKNKDFVLEQINGIYDVGSGESSTFQDVALMVSTYFATKIDPIPVSLAMKQIPDHIGKGSQPYTKAKMSIYKAIEKVSDIDYGVEFSGKPTSLTDGVVKYLNWLEKWRANESTFI